MFIAGSIQIGKEIDGYLMKHTVKKADNNAVRTTLCADNRHDGTDEIGGSQLGTMRKARVTDTSWASCG